MAKGTSGWATLLQKLQHVYIPSSVVQSTYTTSFSYYYQQPRCQGFHQHEDYTDFSGYHITAIERIIASILGNAKLFTPGQYSKLSRDITPQLVIRQIKRSQIIKLRVLVTMDLTKFLSERLKLGDLLSSKDGATHNSGPSVKNIGRWGQPIVRFVQTISIGGNKEFNQNKEVTLVGTTN